MPSYIYRAQCKLPRLFLPRSKHPFTFQFFQWCTTSLNGSWEPVVTFSESCEALIAWHWPWWKYLHHEIQQMLQIRTHILYPENPLFSLCQRITKLCHSLLTSRPCGACLTVHLLATLPEMSQMASSPNPAGTVNILPDLSVLGTVNWFHLPFPPIILASLGSPVISNCPPISIFPPFLKCHYCSWVWTEASSHFLPPPTHSLPGLYYSSG